MSDGGRVLGRVVDAATRATAPGRPHTTAQAGTVYVVAVVYGDRDVPPGKEPGLARMIAGYVADTDPFSGMDDDVNTPAVSGESAHGRFLDPQEAHPAFGFSYSGALSTDPGRLFQRLAGDPEAFGILYDAERAYFAYYLERLTRQGTDPDARPQKGRGAEPSDATLGPDLDLEEIGRHIGALMNVRASGARDGTISDLAAYDAAVRVFHEASVPVVRSQRPVGALLFTSTATLHRSAWGTRARVAQPQAVSPARVTGIAAGRCSESGGAMSPFGTTSGSAPQPSRSEAELTRATAASYAAWVVFAEARPRATLASSIRCLPSASLPKSGHRSRNWRSPKSSMNPGSPSASGCWAEKPACGKASRNTPSWSSRRV